MEGSEGMFGLKLVQSSHSSVIENVLALQMVLGWIPIIDFKVENGHGKYPCVIGKINLKGVVSSRIFSDSSRRLKASGGKMIAEKWEKALENNVGKGENCGYQHSLLSCSKPYFQRPLSPDCMLTNSQTTNC